MLNLGPVEVVLLLAAVGLPLFGLFWILRSTPAQGRKVLQRWGIAKPTEEQGMLAADYLKQRRNLFPFVLIAILVLVAVARWLLELPGGVDWYGSVLGSIVGTLLVGELIAVFRRPADRTRSATLVPRRITNLVPRFGLAVLALVVVVGTAFLVATIAIRPWAQEVAAWASRNASELGEDEPLLTISTDLGPMWFAYGMLLVTFVASLGVAWLSLSRGPITSDRVVDAALRIRSARVAVGSGLLVCVGLAWPICLMGKGWAAPASNFDPGMPHSVPERVLATLPPEPAWLDLVARLMGWSLTAILVAGLLSWVILINPWRKQRLVEVNA